MKSRAILTLKVMKAGVIKIWKRIKAQQRSGIDEAFVEEYLFKRRLRLSIKQKVREACILLHTFVVVPIIAIVIKYYELEEWWAGVGLYIIATPILYFAGNHRDVRRKEWEEYSSILSILKDVHYEDAEYLFNDYGRNDNLDIDERNRKLWVIATAYASVKKKCGRSVYSDHRLRSYINSIEEKREEIYQMIKRYK